MEQSNGSGHQRRIPRSDFPLGDVAASRLGTSFLALVLSIVVLAAVVHGIPATTLGLYWDDPELLMQPYQALDYRSLEFVFTDTFDNLRSERPLAYLVYVLLRAAFVHSLAMVHWTLIALFALTAIVLTRVSRLLVADPWFHLATAVTFLLYPLGSVHAIWPSAAHYFAACLLACWTILAAHRGAAATGLGRLGWLATATLAYAACILTHEVFVLVPLAFLGAYFLLKRFASSAGKGELRSVVLATAPLVMTLATYAVWRLAVLPAGDGEHYPATDLVWSPTAITLKTLAGFVTALVPWSHVVTYLWNAAPSALGAMLSVAAAAAIGMMTMTLLRSAAPPGSTSGDLAGTDDGHYARAALIGLALIGAGAVAIAVSPIGIRPLFGASIGSRANLVVAPGIAIAIPALIMVLTRQGRRRPVALPLILLASTVASGLILHRGHRTLLAETLLSPDLFWSYSTGKKLAVAAYTAALIVLAASVLLTIVRRVGSARAGRIVLSLPALSRSREAAVVATALGGLVLVSSLLHFSAKETFLTEWTRHKAMLEDLRSLAPQLVDDTFVVIVHEDPRRAGAPLTVPFADHGELSTYMLALYDNVSIMANVHRRLRFSRDGVTSLSYGWPARWFPPGTRGPTRTHANALVGRIAYDRVALFRYDGRSLTNLAELAVRSETGETLIVKSNTARILSSARPITTRIWRHVTR